MGKMRNLIVIVILQLIITIAETEDAFQFGDMIAIERSHCGIPFNHYVIYVGNKDFGDLKEPDEDIFEFTGKTKDPSDCLFGKLNPTDTYKKKNYLDGYPGFKVGTESEITTRIIDKHKKCPDYKTASNNCEHLATFVRYGERLSLQPGKLIGIFCKNDKKFNIAEIKRKLGPIEDLETTCEEERPKSSSRASG